MRDNGNKFSMLGVMLVVGQYHGPKLKSNFEIKVRGSGVRI